MAFDQTVLGVMKSVFALADYVTTHESLEPQLAAALRTAGRLLEDIYIRLDADINGDYAAYLQSAHWSRIREIVFRRDSYKCQRCGKAHNWVTSTSFNALHCHHITYDRRGEELLDDLVTLCASCHKAVHTDGLFERGLYCETAEELQAWRKEFYNLPDAESDNISQYEPIPPTLNSDASPKSSRKSRNA